MEEIPEVGYMFAYTYSLDEKDIEKIIYNEIEKLDPKYKDYILNINVVKNKHNIKLGYSYLYIDNEKLYYALTGFNLDGSKRLEKIETELEIEDKKIEAWGDALEDVKITYKELEPLIVFPTLELDEKDKIRYRLMDTTVDFNIFQARKYIDPIFKNSLYARYVPHWITEKMVFDTFKIYEKDKQVHHKKGKNFNYPIVKIKNNTINITFSNLYPNTASFLVNMTKKVYFQHDEEASLIFFNQNKKREYDR